MKEKRAKLTKFEAGEIERLSIRRVGLHRLIEETTLVAGQLEKHSDDFADDIRKRLNIGQVILKFDVKARTVTWLETEIQLPE